MSIVLAVLALGTYVDDRRPAHRGLGAAALAVLLAGVLIGSGLWVLAVEVQ
jgi:hypothetical protein